MSMNDLPQWEHRSATPGGGIGVRAVGRVACA